RSKPICCEITLFTQPGAMAVTQVTGIGSLMVVNCMRQRNKQRRNARRSDLGHRHGARAADQKVGFAQTSSHIVNEGLTLRLHPSLLVALSNTVNMLRTGLVHHHWAFMLSQRSQGLG